MHRVTEKDLRRELEVIRSVYPVLSDDELFLLWFFRAYVTDNEQRANIAITGCPKDKLIDGILIDEIARTAVLVRGKYHRNISQTSESRTDVLGFAQLAIDLTGDNKRYGNLVEGMDIGVRKRIDEVRTVIRNRDFRLSLIFVTTGKCSQGLADEAIRTVRQAGRRADIQIIDGRQILRILTDFLDGVAPPIPSLELEMESGHGIRTNGAFNRYDDKTKIESWVFSMTGNAIAELYRENGDKLFARNVRGFLGENTDINKGMEYTIKKEPEYFWYYNNGITIICDEAKHISGSGKDILKVSNPQVINGQQTTRELHSNDPQSRLTSVLVRVIQVPREPRGIPENFERLISRIVVATNWQNEIMPSDLKANDYRQIEIERELRKIGYHYLRKRKTKSEAWASCGTAHDIIKKEELARAVAACDLDPSIVRNAGKEGLFEDRYYDTVFPNSDPFYYMPRYCLVKDVEYAAKGYPERAYAKWLAVHFVWQHLDPELRKNSMATIFIDSWLRDRKSNDYLIKAIREVLVATIRFYRAKRGRGAKAIDVSSFFKRKGLDEEFERFWHGSSNRSRGRFKKAIAKWRIELQNELIGK